MVKFNGVEGDYFYMMYLDNELVIVVGRESSVYFKKFGKLKLFVDLDILVGILKYGKLLVVIVIMGYKYS